MKLYPYLALLRGINVGGNNVIKMTALKAYFEKLGFSTVTTFIQSGNVIFQSAEKNKERLCTQIEKALSNEFSYTARVALISHDQLKEIVDGAPKGFGTERETFRYDVVFLRDPVTAKQAIKDIPLKEGVDTAQARKHALYLSKLISKATQSRLPKIIALPHYKSMTIRNWNSTTKLLRLMDEKLAL